MDKRLILAVAGSGKTTSIVNNLSLSKRFLIITYTQNNYENLYIKIIKKFGGVWPKNITLFTYFSFLYSFCYKPFPADYITAQGIDYNGSPSRYCKDTETRYYFTSGNRFYKNRIACYLIKNAISDITIRVKKYFDSLIIDEVQDFDGWDFDLIERLTSIDVDVCFVGDFFQHTFSTSKDGNKNSNLYNDFNKYIDRFREAGLSVDSTSLCGSWRCKKSICAYVSRELGIKIDSLADDCNCNVSFIEEGEALTNIFKDDSIVKLHYQNSSNYGPHHLNWGDSKGMDEFEDICVLLNANTMVLYKNKRLKEMATTTLRKLYVAITRAHGNVYLADEKNYHKYIVDANK